MKKVGVIFIMILFGVGCAVREPPALRPVVQANWDSPTNWKMTTDGKSTGKLSAISTPWGSGLELRFNLRNDVHGFVQLANLPEPQDVTNMPITLLLQAEGTGDLEIKMLGSDGSVFIRKFALKGIPADWQRVNVYFRDLQYNWGGKNQFDRLAEFHLVVSGFGQGIVRFKDIGFGKPGMPSSFAEIPAEKTIPGLFVVPPTGPRLDPDCDLPGIGFKQRRADKMIPEDPLVLEWLKTLQDVSTPEQNVLPTTEDIELQTFNNSLVAMAFILKGERERAERILDFFAAATVRDNRDALLQNFFLNGEARGFFQAVALKDQGKNRALHSLGVRDRWMGDMAWLLLAYKYYEQQYSDQRYQEISGLLKDLLISWFTDAPGVPGGGYVQHGWRKNDSKLHEDHGHPEGNIDCHAVFKLVGEKEKADKIRFWLETVLTANDLPLDLYTWRVLAYDGDRAELLRIPDCDLRYQKTVQFNGKTAVGPFHSQSLEINNVWLDGLGHLSCAFFAAGDRARGTFYANQYDAFIMESRLGGKITHTLPYTANREGNFEFDQSKGYISVAAWYIFAKNEFNPMTFGK